QDGTGQLARGQIKSAGPCETGAQISEPRLTAYLELVLLLEESPLLMALCCASIQVDIACCQPFCHISAACIQNWIGAICADPRSGIPGNMLEPAPAPSEEPPTLPKPGIFGKLGNCPGVPS